MRALNIKSFAKINLTMEILSAREDGYHNIRSVMCTVPVCDRLIINKSDRFSLRTNSRELSESKENLIYKAFCTFRDSFGFDGGISVNLIKNLPIGAGLGGGSSNCAATLKALAKISKLPKDKWNELVEVSKTLGADVPFFMYGGCALVQGIGEDITSVKAPKGFYIVIVKPTESLYTPFMYKKFDQSVAQICNTNYSNMLLQYINQGNILEMAKTMYNSFEPIAFNEIPEIKTIKKIMMEGGALGSLMSGSGSAVFGIFGSKKNALRFFNCFKDKYKDYNLYYSCM